VIFYFQAQSKLHSSNPLASSNLMEVETPADSTKRAADIKKALTIFVLGASGTSLQSFPSFRDGAAEKRQQRKFSGPQPPTGPRDFLATPLWIMPLPFFRFQSKASMVFDLNQLPNRWATS
jgi:hypothetical protein